MEAWATSSSKYVNAAVANVVSNLKSRGQDHMMPKRVATPFKGGYQPELDVSEELNVEDATYFQSQIGIMRWACELGRIDLITEVSLLASHLALP